MSLKSAWQTDPEGSVGLVGLFTTTPEGRAGIPVWYYVAAHSQ